MFFVNVNEVTRIQSTSITKYRLHNGQHKLNDNSREGILILVEMLQTLEGTWPRVLYDLTVLFTRSHMYYIHGLQPRDPERNLISFQLHVLFLFDLSRLIMVFFRHRSTRFLRARMFFIFHFFSTAAA